MSIVHTACTQASSQVNICQLFFVSPCEGSSGYFGGFAVNCCHRVFPHAHTDCDKPMHVFGASRHAACTHASSQVNVCQLFFVSLCGSNSHFDKFVLNCCHRVFPHARTDCGKPMQVSGADCHSACTHASSQVNICQLFFVSPCEGSNNYFDECVLNCCHRVFPHARTD